LPGAPNTRIFVCILCFTHTTLRRESSIKQPERPVGIHSLHGIVAPLACRVAVIGLALFLSQAAVAGAGPDNLFIEATVLPDGKVLVVAEARLEPRSIGSYSVRLYSGANPGYPYDDFLSGLVVARDGTVERIGQADIDGDGAIEAVVVTRSVGSGGYLSAQAFSIAGNEIREVARIEGVGPRQDPVEQLKD
jgi:hypothetical protein